MPYSFTWFKLIITLIFNIMPTVYRVYINYTESISTIQNLYPPFRTCLYLIYRTIMPSLLYRNMLIYTNGVRCHFLVKRCSIGIDSHLFRCRFILYWCYLNLFFVQVHEKTMQWPIHARLANFIHIWVRGR